MGLMTKAEYIESLRKLKPTVYMFGQKVEDVVDNPRLRAGIEPPGPPMNWPRPRASRPDRDTQQVDRRADQPFQLTPPASIADLVARVKMNRLLGRRVGTCFQRCTGQDCMAALSVTTYDVDRKYGTDYNKRFLDFLKYMQKNDLVANAGVTDVKGDRNLSPKEQPDKDVYLHVVEKGRTGSSCAALSAIRPVHCRRTRSLFCRRARCERVRRNSRWPSPSQATRRA